MKTKVFTALRDELARVDLPEHKYQNAWIVALKSYWSDQLVQQVDQGFQAKIKLDDLLKFQLTKLERQHYGGDGYFLALFEFKVQGKKQPQTLCAKALLQCIFYQRQMSSKLPDEAAQLKVFVVATEKRIWCFPVEMVLKHSEKVVDWKIAPAKAFEGNKDAYKALKEDLCTGDLQGYYSNIWMIADGAFTLDSVRHDIIACAQGQRFRPPVDETNVFLWFKKFCEYVLLTTADKEPPMTYGGSDEKVQLAKAKFEQWEKDIRRQVMAFFACLKAHNIDQICRGGKLLCRVAEETIKEVKIPSKQRLQTFLNSFRRVGITARGKIAASADDFLKKTLSRKFRGDFYTPSLWVDQACEVLDTCFPEWKTALVWDASCGTGNLTADRQLPFLVQTTLFDEDVSILRARGTNRGAIAQQKFDFLKGMSCPEPVVRVVSETDDISGIVFLNNPPFKTGANLDAHGESKKTKGVSMTGVGQLMKETKFNAQQVYNHFLYKITHLASEWVKEIPPNKPIYNAIFLPTNAFCGSQDYKFLDYYFKKWEFQQGFTFPMSEFRGTKGKEVSVCFTLWRFGAPTASKSLALTLMNKSKGVATLLGSVPTYYGPREDFLNMWWKEKYDKKQMVDCLPLSNAMTVDERGGKSILRQLPKGAIGYFASGSPTIKENNQQVYILSSARGNKHGAPLVRTRVLSGPNHWSMLKAFAAFFVRRAVTPGPSLMWKVGHVVNRHPKVRFDSTEFIKWAVNCAVFACFDGKSSQAATRNVKYRNATYDMHNEFFFLSVEEMRELAKRHEFGELADDIEFHGDERFLYKFLRDNKEELLPEARAVLEAAKKLWHSTFPLRKETQHILVKDGSQEKKNIPAHLECWDAGWYQIRRMLDKHNDPELDEMKDELLNAMDVLKERLWNGIFSFGFLPKQLKPILRDDQGSDPLAVPFLKILQEFRGRKEKKGRSIEISDHFTPEQDDALLDQMEKMGKGRGWSRIPVPGDGDCGPRSLSLYLVHGDQHLLRFQVSEWAKRNEKFQQLLADFPDEQELSPLQVIGRFGDQGGWVGLDFFKAASDMLERPIYLIHMHGCHTFGVERYADDDPIYVAFNAQDEGGTDGNHFDPLIISEIKKDRDPRKKKAKTTATLKESNDELRTSGKRKHESPSLLPSDTLLKQTMKKPDRRKKKRKTDAAAKKKRKTDADLSYDIPPFIFVTQTKEGHPGHHNTVAQTVWRPSSASV